VPPPPLLTPPGWTTTGSAAYIRCGSYVPSWLELDERYSVRGVFCPWGILSVGYSRGVNDMSTSRPCQSVTPRATGADACRLVNRNQTG